MPSRRTRRVVADDYEATRVLIATNVGLLGEVDVVSERPTEESRFAWNRL